MKSISPLLKTAAAVFIIAVIISFWVSMRQSGAGQDKKTDTASSIIDHSSGGLIDLTSPVAGARVSSPLIVKGTASGSWFFEGSFPVEVLDSDRAVIGKGLATSTFDWMTTGFIPFRATISIDKKPLPGSHGSILLKRDNPSGDAANDQSIEVPVIFN